MGEGTADGQQRDGKRAADERRELSEAKPDASHAMVEDANSQRMQADEKGGVGSLRGSDAAASSCDTIGVPGDTSSMGREEPIRAGIVTGDDDQIESSLVLEFGPQNPAMGSSSQPDFEADIEEASNHLFTDAMKLQLRAQILVLGDLLKGIAPSPDWLEEACLEPGIGAESVLPEPMDAPRAVPAESNLQRISSAFQTAGARMSPFSGSADPPTTTAAIKAELHAAGRLSNPGEPSSSGKEFLFRDDSLAQETDVAPSGQLMITYDHTTTARSNSNVAEDNSQATEIHVHDNDKHLDLAQASAQDALTTATSALAQSHMVWARLHSQNHSEEGVARDARIASVAATVAAAASVAKAAVEAARAIAEVSMDAFIQAGGYEVGDTSLAQFGSTRSRPLQVAGWDQSLHSNTRENATLSSQHRADMVESVVQAAGKAAEAATQAGVVLAKANPLIQTCGLSGFWSRKLNEADVEHEGNLYGEMNEANEMDAANEVDGFDGGGEVDALNEMNAVNEVDELDGVNEEDAVEEMEDIVEEDTASQDKLDVGNGMGDVHEEDIANQDVAEEDDVAAANGDEDGVAAANEAEAFVANGNRMVAANGDEVVGANEAEVAASNEDEVAPVNEVAEPIEQEKSIGPRSRKFKRGRGRARGRGSSQGVSSRAKRYKNSIGVSSAILSAQTPENEMHQKDDVPESQKNVRVGNTRGNKRGAKHMKNTPINTSEEDTPATASAETPENEMHKKDDVPESPKNVRDGNARRKKRGADYMENTTVITSGEDTPATALTQTLENELHKKDDVRESPKNVRGGNARGKKRSAKHMENTTVSTSGEDTPATTPAQPSWEDTPATAPAQTPENEMHKKDDVPESPKNVRGGNARGKTRGARQMENTPVSTSGKGTAKRGLREPESDRNTREVPENTVEGSAVEVMTDEVGLRGGWFAGTVLRMTPNEAFVELHDLLTDDGKANVREWFPLVEGFNPYRPRRHVRPVHPFSIFTEAGSRKRRRVALGSQTWHIGDHVDAFFQDAWWEGIVAELNDIDPSKATIYFPEENDTQVVKTWDLRPSFQWKDNKWMPWKNPVLVEDERPQKRQRNGGPIKRATKDGTDELIAQKSNGKSSKGRTERTDVQEDSEIMPEPTSARKKSPIKVLQENKISFKRSRRSKISFKRLKKSENKNAGQKHNGRSTINRRKALQEDVLSPGTSKKLDFTMESIAPTASASKVDAALGKTSRTKAKPRHWRKKDT